MGSFMDMMRKRKKPWYLKVVAFSALFLFLLRTTYLKLLPGEPYVSVNRVPWQGRSVVREMFRTRDKTEQAEVCSIPHLKHRLLPRSISGTNVLCKRLQPIKDSCKVARELFQQKKPKKKVGCQPYGAESSEFCKIKRLGHALSVFCNTSACDTSLELGVINIETGSFKWKKMKNRLALKGAIKVLLRSRNFGFCLIKCKGNNLNDSSLDYRDHYHDYTNLYQQQYLYENGLDLPPPQILNLPPYVGSQGSNKMNKSTYSINFNLIFIDSVSRHHFFRSLPKTVQHFEKMNQQHSGSKFSDKLPIILDFELVQGIRSRTYESLQALFSGSVNPFEKPFSTLAMPPSPLKTERLLKPLKELGYKTLWLEDLCYLWEWGISKDLLVHNKTLTQEETWKRLQAALRRSGIDSLGNSYAHCEILNHNGVNDHFHGPDKVCYNGKHQHYYAIKYLKDYQESMHSTGQPYFTFFETNIGHEDTGVRIQDFDMDFVEYLKFVESQDNMLTILFSDHGNAYGDFMEKSREARIELFHPFLFIILPKGVKSILDSSDLNSLIVNQERLISMLDLHYSLTYLISNLYNQQQKSSIYNFQHLFHVAPFNEQFNVTSRGLFSRIPESRTCGQMPRINPNLCICEGFEMAVTYSPHYFVLALYAVGKLNNHIQKQRRQGLGMKVSRGGFGSCERLVVKRVENIRESRSEDDKKTVKMDIHTQSPQRNKTEIFFVTMEIQIHLHTRIQLTKFERITAYSHYSQCSDTGVDLQLCVCDMIKRQPVIFVKQSVPHIYNGTVTEKSIVDINGEKCLHVVGQSVDKGGTIFEAFNSCTYRLSLNLIFNTSNLILSSGKQALVKLFPKDVTFLMAGIIENEKKDWTWSLEIAYQII